MKIGVFDSGIGGQAVADAIAAAFPMAQLTVVNDRENVPYGEKTAEHIRELTEAGIQPLLEANCDIIVIACNSATAAAIEYLRETYPQQTFIGLEPMVKPAARATSTGVITLCATPATLTSDRYQRLKSEYAADIEVYEPDCSGWAKMIEDNTVNEAVIESIIQSSNDKNADVIVLACTHYHWIRSLIQTHAPGATILDPSDAVIRRIRQLSDLQSR